jgi:CCDC81-like prokaryotic HU domain 2/CCDC81-like prokaryotic HU domain 1/SPOR domain
LKVLKIKDYIKELLFTNQGVVIPGLGGFVSEYEPAAFDVSENKFLPPSKKITFKSDYSFQDSLLIKFISKKENLDKEKAKKILDDFVKEIKSGLKKGDKIDFSEIGTLLQTAKGEIQFKQSAESNLLTESYGLKSVKTKPIKSNKISIKTTKPVKQKKSYKKHLIYGLSSIVVICLFAASWFFTDGYKNFSMIHPDKDTEVSLSENKALLTTEKNLDSIARADSIKALIVHSIDDNTVKKDALFYEAPEKQEPKTIYSEFHIIAGSFKKIENAEEFASKIRDKGYSTEIIQSRENLIRIAIFSFTDESEALKKLYKLRETADLNSVWILKIK